MTYRFILLAASLLPAAVSAATLTTVPMQGTMVMPMINYDDTTDTLSVMMPTNVPQLTPLLVSNPGDGFDPVSPWFEDLDPSARGKSFSRRYGFVMDAGSDTLPGDRAIWLRKTSGDADLDVFRYAATPAPGLWQPVFGTAGTTNALMWNQMMFHPAFTAMPGTNTSTATFEAYLVDTGTGLEVPGSSTVPMVFTFTNVPDGRPELGLGVTFAIAWDAGVTNYAVEYAASVDAATWTTATNEPITIDGRPTIMLRTDEAAGMYFRMRKLP